MIDTLALALGHVLLGIALLRLALRGDVDDDPRIIALQAEAKARRKSTNRAARRKADVAAASEHGDD
ncbi:MAG: hypothetical protein ACXIUO_10370 [Erythrobacter sp.]